MTEEHAKLIQQIIEVGAYLRDRSIIWGNSGNISARLDDTTMLITASGSNLGNLAEDDIVEVVIDTGTFHGAKKPSKEVPMHLGVYQSRNDVHFVIHASPFWSTMFACSDLKLESGLFIESMYYLERVGYVDYFHPGSEALGKAVEQVAKEADVIFLKNHGLIVSDVSMAEARMRIETVEFACRMIATAHNQPVPLQALGKDTVLDFLNNAGYKPRRAGS